VNSVVFFKAFFRKKISFPGHRTSVVRRLPLYSIKVNQLQGRGKLIGLPKEMKMLENFVVKSTTLLLLAVITLNLLLIIKDILDLYRRTNMLQNSGECSGTGD